MASVVTLAEAKGHLRVTDTSEDTQIQLYVDAATDYIKNFLDTTNPPINAAIKGAALLFVADLYENREATVEGNRSDNPAVMRLLFPYRKCLGV